MITVVSAVYGGYDEPAVPPEQDIDVRWVMVTDGTVTVPEPWEEIVEHRRHLHPRMAAKIPKCLPFAYVDTDIAIWLDSSALIRTSTFARTCRDALGDGDVAQWVHPERVCVVDEADVSSRMAKYAGQPVKAQAAHYIAAGHPERFGLWATGCMVWRRGGYWPNAWGQAWLAEQSRWTYQDQLSWPQIVRSFNIDVRPLPGSLWDHQLVSFRPHASPQ